MATSDIQGSDGDPGRALARPAYDLLGVRRAMALLALGVAAACSEQLPTLGVVEAPPTCRASDEAFVL